MWGCSRNRPEACETTRWSPMRFLHLADLHLDTSFAGRSEALRTRLREAAREALRAAVDRALAEDVDAVLLAGDLFDGERLSYRTERFLVEALERLTAADIAVIYATGNHDPGSAGGSVGRIAWPDGVTLLTDPEPRRVPVTRDGRTVGWVTGAGHASAREERDLSRSFPRPEGRLPEVALLHTQVLGAGGAEAHDRYAPSELPYLLGSGYDYWALGHIHRPQCLSSEPAVHYPGSVQGCHPGETGARGGLLVDLGADGPAEVEFVELAPVRWETLEVDELDELTRLPSVSERIRAAWQRSREVEPAPPGTEWIVRVRLVGASPLYRELATAENLEELARELQATLGLLGMEVRAHDVHAPVDPAAHQDRTDVVGEALRLMARIQSGEEPGVAGALGISPEELAGAGTRDPEAYLRQILEGQEPALLEALLERKEDR